ncbi:MAG: RsbRD N-terminal domain-containing protein [Candidatus Krumholzibacteriia bacterium]
MALQDHLLGRKAALARAWYERILTTYPAESARLLGRNTESFGNPVGQTMMPALEAIVEGLATGANPEVVRPHLDAIIRIRAVQTMRPGVALVFLVQLKDLVRDEAQASGADAAEVRALEESIDGALLLSFDLYTACREQVHGLRQRDQRRRTEAMTPGRPGGVARRDDHGNDDAPDEPGR